MKIKLTTPVGTIKFPRVETETINNEVKKKYSLSIILDPADKGVPEFLEKLNNAIATSEYPNSKSIIKEDSDKTDEIGADGKPIYTANGKVSIGMKSTYPITHYDAKKNPIKDIEMVGWMSRCRVAFILSPVPTYKCMAKYITGIQIIELKGGGSAESCGFGEEEGYTNDTGKIPENIPWDEN